MQISLGSKIKKYRKRSGLSQMELEVAIESSPGSISRIESGKVNPTKETLGIIATQLNLSGLEKADLFEIPIEEFTLIGQVINEFSSEVNLSDALQKAVNLLSERVGYISTAIFLLEGDRLWLKHVSDNSLTRASEKLIGKRYINLSISEKEDPKNLLLRCALDSKVYESTEIYQFGRGAVPRIILRGVEKISKFKRGLSIPLKFMGKPIGCIYFAKPFTEDYEIEVPMLEIFAKQIGILCGNLTYVGT